MTHPTSTRRSGETGGPWLGRFQDPRAIRCRGLLDVYTCREVEDLEPRLVLIGNSEADSDMVCQALDAIAQAHELVVDPLIPRVDERGRIGTIEYLSLHCDAEIDLERGFQLLASTGEKAQQGVGMCMMNMVHTALIKAHAVTNPSTGQSYALGSLAWSSFLLSADGTPWLLGLGHNFPVRGRPRSITVSPGLCEAPEVTAGIEPTSPSDVYACYMMLRSFAPWGELLPALAAGLAGTLDGQYAELTKVMAHTNAKATALSPAMRFQTLAELSEAYVESRGLYMETLKPDVMRAFFVNMVGRIGEIPDRRAVDQDFKTGSHQNGGRYRLDIPIDSGATSLVWLAHDRQLDQMVAMKVLRAECTEEVRRRFYREIRILRAVRHKHLVRGYDFFEESGRLVGVMEYVDGDRFDHACDVMTVDEIIARSAEVLEALAALHGMGVIHRDVKPQNIIVSPGKGAVLVDFGIAAEADSNLTRTRPMGTRGYVAPEVLAGMPVMPVADVFALSTVLAQALVGHEVPEHVARALELGLAAQPNRRPGAAEMAAMLRQDHVREPASRPHGVLTVKDGGRVFMLPSGERLDLSRRRAPRLILLALLDGHAHHPGRPYSWEDLLEVGWPGEHMGAESGKGRVYVAIYTLRKMGLDEYLVRVDDGYLLDPKVTVSR